MIDDGDGGLSMQSNWSKVETYFKILKINANGPGK